VEGGGGGEGFCMFPGEYVFNLPLGGPFWGGGGGGGGGGRGASELLGQKRGLRFQCFKEL